MKNRFFYSLLLLSALVFLLEDCNKQQDFPAQKDQSQPVIDSITTALPKPDHIVIAIEENHGYSQIIGSSSAPYINALSKDAYSANFTKSYAITHPSQPNYLDFYSGSNQGVTNDNNPPNDPFITPNLGRQLINSSCQLLNKFIEGKCYNKH